MQSAVDYLDVDEVLRLLEPSQLSTYRHDPLGRMRLTPMIYLSLWTLRLYLLFMVGLVVLRFTGAVV